MRAGHSFSLAAMPALTLLGAVAGCHHGAGPLPTVDHAWVRLAAVPGRPSAAYFTLRGGTDPARLVAVASPSAGDIELHDSMTGANGMMTMTRLDGVDVAPGGKIEFVPGGRHAMVYGLAPGIAAGGTVKLSFRFAKGQPAVLDAKAVGAGDPPPY